MGGARAKPFIDALREQQREVLQGLPAMTIQMAQVAADSAERMEIGERKDWIRQADRQDKIEREEEARQDKLEREEEAQQDKRDRELREYQRAQEV